MHRYRFLIVEGLVDLKTLKVRVKVFDGSGMEYGGLSSRLERYLRNVLRQQINTGRRRDSLVRA